MVIAAYYSRRKRRENLAAGRTEGLEEANAVWREWNRRRMAAEKAGQLFEEPPPDFDNGASEQ
ncbi:MAG: hypothetical protein OXU28_14635 [Chloroflexota bacterium]|nr:hypothetical protein [Chloroflexota bacterium]